MSEPSQAETQQVAEIFATAYNKKNATHFQWNDKLSYQPKNKAYGDFILYDSHTKKQLVVQLTRAVADPDREFVRPKQASLVVEPLRQGLEQQNFDAISIYINFENQPSNKEQAKKLVYWLELIISQKIKSSIRPSYYTYDKSFDSQYLPRISAYISELIISPIGQVDQKGYISVSYGYSKEYPEPWIDDEQRVSAAVKKKEASDLSNCVLLVDSGYSPIHEIYIPLIKKQLTDSKIDEIWIADNFLSPRRAFQVK